MKEQLIGEVTNYILKICPDAKVQEIKTNLVMILREYSVGPTETALAIRNEDKNAWFLQKFLINKTVKGLTEKTLKVYQQEIARALNEIGKNADDIEADDIRLFLALKERRDGWSKTTCNNTLRYLRTFFAFLALEEFISKNPTAKIDNIKVEKVQRKAFQEIEVETLRSACKNERETLIVEMLLSTGCRVSELVNIKISELEGDQVVVHGKGKKDRTVYLTAKAQLALQNYLAFRKDSNPWLFPKLMSITEAAKKGLTNKLLEGYKYPKVIIEGHSDTGTIESTVRKIGKRCGVRNVHPHRFRRTCATYALRHGMPIEQVSKMLGHEQINTTQIYLDQDERMVKAAHQRYVI